MLVVELRRADGYVGPPVAQQLAPNGDPGGPSTATSTCGNLSPRSHRRCRKPERARPFGGRCGSTAATPPRENVTVVVGGIMQVPLQFYAGALIDDEGAVQLFDWERNEKRWKALTESDDKSRFAVTGAIPLTMPPEVVSSRFQHRTGSPSRTSPRRSRAFRLCILRGRTRCRTRCGPRRIRRRSRISSCRHSPHWPITASGRCI